MARGFLFIILFWTPLRWSDDRRAIVALGWIGNLPTTAYRVLTYEYSNPQWTLRLWSELILILKKIPELLHSW